MLIGSNVEFFDNENIDNNFKTILSINDKDIKNKMWLKSCFIHPAVMFRKTIFNDIDLYNPKAKHFEDAELFNRIMKKFKVENLSDILVKCEIRNSGISTRKETEQAISGLIYKLRNPDVFDKYWYISVFKSLIRIVIKRQKLNYTKRKLGLIK